MEDEFENVIKGTIGFILVGFLYITLFVWIPRYIVYPEYHSPTPTIAEFFLFAIFAVFIIIYLIERYTKKKSKHEKRV